MAIYPGMLKNRGVRSSTVITNPSSPGGAAKITSAALQTSGSVRVSQKDVTDPARLVKVINDLQSAQEASTQATRSNPFSSPCIVRGVSFGPFSIVTIPHTLGRPVTDWHSSRVSGNVQLAEIRPGNPLYPLQGNPNRILVVENALSGSGSANIVIVGD